MFSQNYSCLMSEVVECCTFLYQKMFTDECFTFRQCGEKKVVGAACWGHSPRLKMSVRDGAATMVTNVAGGGGGGRPASPNNHDNRSYLLQIYPRLVAQPTSCCNLRLVRSSPTALTVQVLHVDKMGKLCHNSWQTEIWLISRLTDSRNDQISNSNLLWSKMTIQCYSIFLSFSECTRMQQPPQWSRT